MPYTDEWIASSMNRKSGLEKLGIFWRHDGNPRRPYVRLTSGFISDGYFNGARLCEHPVQMEAYVQDLVNELHRRKHRSTRIDRVIGPAIGAITFAHATAAAVERTFGLPKVLTSFAEKDGERFIIKRNLPGPKERILLVEDTITTGGSVVKTLHASSGSERTHMPFVLAFCNRSGHRKIANEFEIISLVTEEFKIWVEGANPFTRDGKEVITPVSDPKVNWKRLTQEY